MAYGFVVKSGASATALAANTAKTICNIISGAKGVTLVEFSVSFDGVTASAVPVLVELCSSTQAGAGTPGASPTPAPVQPYGGEACLATAGVDYSAEPTTLTPLFHWLVTPNGGLLVIQYPLGREVMSQGSGATNKALCLRLTAPAIVNARAYMRFEE